jgi:hypothetical protein
MLKKIILKDLKSLKVLGHYLPSFGNPFWDSREFLPFQCNF